MIKVGIIGADSLMAGELLRLLVIHPEVELVCAYAPSQKGRALTSYHHGLIGETELRFSNNIDWSKLDLLFVISSDSVSLPPVEQIENLKVIHIQENDEFHPLEIFGNLNYLPGVSEMFRKPLVRGAVASRILPPYASVAVIVLFPLALHLLLNDSLSIKISVPKERDFKISKDTFSAEIESILHLVQLSFNKINNIEIEQSSTVRALIFEAEFNCDISVQEIERVYDEVYDDHNFTFIVPSDPSPSEVAGTHKCLIYISKEDDKKLKIKAVADSVMRGGAGDAIHTMNLLFGLFEKIGLSLPAGLAFNGVKG